VASWMDANRTDLFALLGLRLRLWDRPPPLSTAESPFTNFRMRIKVPDPGSSNIYHNVSRQTVVLLDIRTFTQNH
jgi:hypothetical protein